MSGTPTATRRRPELPRLVEQVRVLLWFQMHLTLLALLVTLLVFGITHSALEVDQSDAVVQTLLGLTVLAIALGVSSRLVRHRWPPVLLLVVLTEAGVVWFIVRAVAGGVVRVLLHRSAAEPLADMISSNLLALLYVVFTGWTIVNLFRREVWGYLLRLRR
jgi:hypothetical protein